MKIDNSAKNVGPAPSPSGSRVSANRAATASAKAESPATEKSTTVVSTTLNAVSNSQAPFNAQKVAEIRQAISEGRFQINPERIADGLISSVREMLDQNRRAK